MKGKRNTAPLLVLSLLLALSLSACGGSSDGMKSSAGGMAMQSTEMAMPASAGDSGNGYWMDEADYAAEAPMEPETEAKGASGAGETGFQVPESVKMVYRANLELQTTEFERASADLSTLVDQLSGYFEEQSVRNYSSGYRYAHYTIRVPSAKFQPFLNQVGSLFHVVYQTQSAENITEQYYDTQSRLSTAQIKLKRLQELLSRAEEMSDIITIESAISETEYQIEYLSGEMRHYDALVGYSTIVIDLNEVYKLTGTEDAPLTFAARLGRSFEDGLSDFGEFLEDLVIWFAYHWLGLLTFVLVLVVLFRVLRWARRRRAERQPGQPGTPKKMFAALRKKHSKQTEQEESGQIDD